MMKYLALTLTIACVLAVGTITLAYRPATPPTAPCLLPSVAAGYDIPWANGVPQAAIHCVNLPRLATGYELDMHLYAGECLGRDTTYVPCLNPTR